MTLDLEDFYFVFGPNQSYWFDGPKCCEYGGIPESWDAETRRHVHRLDSLAMGPQGEKFLRFHDRDGCEYLELNPPLQTLHPALSAHLLASRPHAPRLAFGPQGTGAALAWSDAHVYPQRIPAGTGAGRVLFLALNPYRADEFFLLLSDHTALFRVPLSARRSLERALRRHRVCASPFPLSPSPSRKHKKNKYWKDLASVAAGQVAGAVVTTVASAVVGSAACAVM
ncbi:hypothetical protein F4775DRAFT_600062 [Biscogniauxia sp. FL1348]|nr:hypothetical protein F4775DRAFT_600062 [Biscogniauxia sp. FL1348]